ncbi:MAG: ABC transporter permease [Cyclobacteriaceae bacterium]
MRTLFIKIYRNPLAFFIGQLSLFIGISASLVIFSFTSFHRSFDTCYTDYDKIYRINGAQENGQPITLTDGKLSSLIKTNFPDTEVTHYMYTPLDLTFSTGRQSITSEKGLLIDESFTNVFRRETLAGSADKLSDQPNSIILTQSLAKRLFENYPEAVGESLSFRAGPREITVNIVAVVADLPANSSLNYDYLLNGRSVFFWNDENPQPVFSTFIRTGSQRAIYSIADFLSEKYEDHGLQKLTDIHLDNPLKYESLNTFNKNYLIILDATGVLIFAITLFNFLNLFYTTILSRIRQITTRKVLGASRLAIASSLVKESFLSLVCGFLLSGTFLYFGTELINQWLSVGTVPGYFNDTFYLLLFASLAITFFMVLIAVYHIASYQIQSGLKGNPVISRASLKPGKIALALQVMLTLFAITYGVVSNRQASVLKEASVGYNYRNAVTIKRSDDIDYAKWKLFEEQLKAQSSVVATGLAVFPAIGEYNQISLQDLTDGTDHKVNWLGIDDQYLSAMQITFISGRNFNSELEADKSAVIVNKEAFRQLGGEEGIDHQLKFRRKSVTVIGVVENFQYESLKETTGPVVMTLNNPQSYRHMIVRFATDSGKQMNSLISKAASVAGINGQLSVNVLEDDYENRLMAGEKVIARTSLIFTIIAVFISMIGLTSYLHFYLKQHKKEFSIRMILGAGIGNNFLVIFRPQLKVILFALITVLPVAYLLLNSWIDQFIYQAVLSPALLSLPVVVLASIISILSIIFTFKIHSSDTLLNLKDE